MAGGLLSAAVSRSLTSLVIADSKEVIAGLPKRQTRPCRGARKWAVRNKNNMLKTLINCFTSLLVGTSNVLRIPKFNQWKVELESYKLKYLQDTFSNIQTGGLLRMFTCLC